MKGLICLDNKKITFYTTIKKTNTIQPIESSWCAFTSDYNSVRVDFVVTDLRPDEIRTVTPTIVLIMEDGSTVQRTKEQIVQKNNVFSYKLKDREGQHTGVVKTQLKLATVTGESYQSNIHTFTLLESLDSIPIPKEFVIDDIQNILQEVKHHITHIFKDEETRKQVFADTIKNLIVNEKQRETWFNQSQQTRASLFQVFMDEAQDVLKDAQQVKDLFDELTETGIIETNIREKLGELETSYAPRLSTLEQNDVSLTAQLQQTEQELNAQLAQTSQEVTKLETNKMDKDTTNIGVNQINKNLGKFDQSYMTDEFLQQMAGNTPINAVPADYSLTPNKFAFPIVEGVVSKNLFNKATVKENTALSGTSGVEVSETGWYASDFIPVVPNTNYYKNMWFATFFYDANKTFLSASANGVYAITSPSNAVFMRVVFTPIVTDVTPENGQVELGTVGTSYESFGAKIQATQIKDHENLLRGFTKVYPWRNATIVNDNTVNLGYRPTFQSVATGKRIFFNMDTTPNFTLNDPQQLIFEWDEKTDLNLTDLSRIKVILSNQALAENQHVLFSNIGGLVSSPINIYQQNIYKYQNPMPVFDTLKPLSVNTTLKKEAPDFYQKHKLQEQDVTAVLIGDSISTTNNYTTPRADVKNRPPLMVEQAYVTEIEEMLRWDGQKYYRYDTDVFTESATSKVTKEYDLAWDWGYTTEDKLNTINNRPALTRVLDGTNASVSYTVPTDVKRCDFIYRTDYLNATNATVTVSASGVLQVFDETTQSWIEANGYVYSAKETDTIIAGTSGNLRKSMYQKRLKMKVVGTLSNTVVTITNNGLGRLTYWGIQTGMRNFMFDFILSARGGHSIPRLENFEAWDVDYYKPDLILWEIPIINQNLDVGNTDFTGKSVGARTNSYYANAILTKANQLKAKSYAPELVSWIMFFGKGNNAINTNNEWVYGIANNGEKVSVPSYLFKTSGMLQANGHDVIDLFSLYMDYAKKKSKQDGKNIIDSVLNASGMTGSTLTIDGTHFNDLGSKVTTQMFDSFFIQ